MLLMFNLVAASTGPQYLGAQAAYKEGVVYTTKRSAR